jgi:hypothetical protein
MLRRTQERLQADVAHCAHELGACASRADHSDVVAVVREVARSCETLAQGRERRAATIDALAQHSEEMVQMAAEARDDFAAQVLCSRTA